MKRLYMVGHKCSRKVNIAYATAESALEKLKAPVFILWVWKQ